MDEKEKQVIVEEEKELVESEAAETETENESEQAAKEEKPKKKKKEKLEDKLETIETELKTVKDKYYRALAEMDNFKKRMSEDLKKERKYAGYSLANKLIDSIELFNQTLNMETQDPTLKNFLYGFKMIDDMIYNALKEEGVSLIDTKVGMEFDPKTQQAMDKEYDPEKPEHTVLKIIKKGYTFKDRLLRPSLVVINIKPDETGEAETEQKTEQENENIVQ